MRGAKVNFANMATGMSLAVLSFDLLYLAGWKDWLGRLISNAFKNVGLEGGAHRLRHTYGTFWDGDEIILQRIMGHSSLATTKRYRGMRLSMVIEQHRKYSPLRLILDNKTNML